MDAIDSLKNYVLVDGFHVIVDLIESKGSWIVDQGTKKKYLDCYSQFASQALGWNHRHLLIDRVNAGIVAKHKLANSDMYSSDYVCFVEAFAKITPDFQHYFFIDGGALAVENSLKAAFDWKAKLSGTPTEKLDVIHLKEAFHGRSGYTLSLTNTDPVKTDLFPKFNWTRITNPKIHFPEDEIKVNNLETISLQEAETALKNGNISAIIVEPIQGEGGDNHFRKSYFEGLRELADRYDAMLIFDEVQTGLGLTGKMWAYEHFGVIPDMMCFGKKTQVCGFCSTERIDSVTDNVFKVSGRINSTWGGNIVDMYRAAEIFRVIEEEKLIENAANVGTIFLESFRQLEAYHEEVTNTRGRGLMLAFDLPTTERRDEVFNRLLDNMLALKSGKKSIRFRPHLTFSEEDIQTAIGFIEYGLSGVNTS